jgi:hypothetical protein
MNGLHALTFLSRIKTLIDLRKALYALLPAMLCVNAWCQANPVQESSPDNRQDRRQELRSTVRQQLVVSNHAKPSDKTVQSDGSAAKARQLSAAERTELRRQLANDPRGQRTNAAAVEQR